MDEATLQDRVEWEQDLLCSLQQIVSDVCKAMGPDAMPALRASLLPIFLPLLQPANSLELRLMAACTLLDAVEFAGAAAELLPALTPVIFEVGTYHPT